MSQQYLASVLSITMEMTHARRKDYVDSVPLYIPSLFVLSLKLLPVGEKA